MKPDFLNVVLTRVGFAGLLLALCVPTTPQVMGEVNALKHYRINQYHKMLEPRLLVVPAGSIVEFPNRDPWLQNVFSVSRSKRFDVGLYEAGEQKAVTFDRTGVSYLFCNIHPEMMAIEVCPVLSDTPKYAESIGNVPHGKYVLHVWYENATPQVLEVLQRTVFVGDDNRNQPIIQSLWPVKSR